MRLIITCILFVLPLALSAENKVFSNLTLEQNIGSSDNANRQAEGDGASFIGTTAIFSAVLRGEIFQSSTQVFLNRQMFPDEEVADNRTGSLLQTFTVAPNSRWTNTLSFSGAVLNAKLASQDRMTTESAEDILNTRDANLRASLSSQLVLPSVDFSFSATVNDRTFFDAEINENNTIERSDQNRRENTFSGAFGFVGWEGVRPVLTLTMIDRVYDDLLDFNGNFRSSQAEAITIGFESLSDSDFKIAADVGWLKERFDDELLVPINIPTVSASLDWNATSSLTFGAGISTSTSRSTIPDVSGSRNYTALLEVEMQMAFGKSISLTVEQEHAQLISEIPDEESSRTRRISGRFDKRYTDALELFVSFERESFESDFASSNFSATDLSVGLSYRFN